MRNIAEVAGNFIGAGAAQISELSDYYNEHCYPLVAPSRRYKIQPGDSWCAMFASVCAHLAGFRGDSFPFEVSVYYQVKTAKEKGCFMPRLSDYTRGDLIVFDWVGGGAFDHVGIVERVTAAEITTIEGNYSGTVKRRIIRRSSAAIAGFIRVGDRSPLAYHKRIAALVKGVLQGEYGDGKKRRDLLGDDYLEVQRRVNEILK